MNGIMMNEPAEPNFPPYPACIPAMLRDIAERFGPREAIVRGDDRMTYAELERRSADLARGLLARGITKGSRVAMVMPNGSNFVTAFMAITRIGAIAAPLSTLLQAPELRWILNFADVDMLLTVDRYLSHDYLARLETALPSLKGQVAGALRLPEAPFLREIVIWGGDERDWGTKPEALLAAGDQAPGMSEALLRAAEAGVTPADPLCMVHTSGSTAHPKSVVHGHGPAVRHAWQKAHDFWVIEPGERFITVRPLFWVAGLAGVLLQGLAFGTCMILAENLQPATILRLIEEEGATAMCGTEADARVLRKDPAVIAGGYEFFSCPSHTIVLARRTQEGLRYLHPARNAHPDWNPPPDPEHAPRSYGMTETLSANTSVGRGQVLPRDKAGSCGRPLPGFFIRIVDPATGQALPPGEVGEIQVAGYCMMLGLYKTERSQTFTPDGFYRTGDLGRMDADGYLHFSSRMSEMIKVSGANVAPLEVEVRLDALPGVERSAVFPLGEADNPTLAAMVQMAPGAAFDEAAIRAELRRQLSSFKVPKRIFALRPEEIPLTGSGKIQKRELAAQLTDRMRAESG